jgi:hypothetical protein
LLVEFQGLGREAVHVLRVAPLGMATSHSHQASHGLFGHVDEPSRAPHTTAFSQMMNDILRSGLWELGIEQGGAASLRKLLPARMTAQQAEAVVPIDLAYGELGLARTMKELAFRIDTR